MTEKQQHISDALVEAREEIRRLCCDRWPCHISRGVIDKINTALKQLHEAAQ